jgi:phage terminase large subunit-like protein
MDVNVTLPEPFQPLFKPARYKSYFGGRGSGKSHSMATALLIEGYRTPLRILCCREVQRSIKDSVKQLLDDKIADMGLGWFYTSTRDGIKGQNGTSFIFSGLGNLTADQIKSYEKIDRCWIEEAQTISARSVEILIPTIRSPGSEIWASWNPRHQSDPIDQRFRGRNPPEGAVIVEVNHNDNPFFPDELTAEMAHDRQANPDRFAHVWLGAYEPSAVGAIFDRQTIHDHRVADAPEMGRVLVSVDPAVSSETGADEHGIIVAGLGSDGRGYVLDDLTTRGSPQKWAERALAGYRMHEADAIVIERNQGGDMCRHTIRTVDPTVKVIDVTASRGKHTRAEPISALYHLGRISHAGSFPELEAQLCLMTAGGYEGEGSPDRVDALVWAFTELFPKLVKKKRKPQGRPRPGGWMG